MDEEKRRLQSTREEIGDSSGGKRIDLESGVVKIGRADEDDADEVLSEDQQDEKTQQVEEAEQDEKAPALSDAAARAKERRARQSR